jgi:hypothetical protein
MFSVPAVQRYKLLCAVTVNAAVSSDSQVHTCVPFLKAAHYAPTDVTFVAEVQRAPSGFSGLVVSMLASGTHVRGLKPG